MTLQNLLQRFRIKIADFWKAQSSISLEDWNREFSPFLNEIESLLTEAWNGGAKDMREQLEVYELKDHDNVYKAGFTAALEKIRVEIDEAAQIQCTCEQCKDRMDVKVVNKIRQSLTTLLEESKV